MYYFYGKSNQGAWNLSTVQRLSASESPFILEVSL